MGKILDIVNKIAPIVQRKASKTGEDLDCLIQEELKKECLGTVQSNQSTQKYSILLYHNLRRNLIWNQ